MGRDPLRPRKKNKVLENPRSGKSETGIHFFREIERFNFKKRESASILALCWPSRLYQLAHSLNLTKSPNHQMKPNESKEPNDQRRKQRRPTTRWPRWQSTLSSSTRKLTCSLAHFAQCPLSQTTKHQQRELTTRKIDALIINSTELKSSLILYHKRQRTMARRHENRCWWSHHRLESWFHLKSW